jgi:UDP-N-acetylmuramate: L-alanyl-gamma-D-glutamyl-meso-diaminopimelate ligase
VLKNYFLRGRHNLVVTGTHGKTTTTALLTWIMEKAGLKPGYVIGGLPKNLGQGARPE